MRNRFFAVLWISISAVLGVTACSSDDEAAATPGPNGGPGPDGRIVRIDELRAQLRPIVDADCQWQFRCCNADERASLLGPTASAAECVDRAFATATHSEYYSQLAAGQTSTAVLSELNRLGYGYDLGRVAVDTAAVQACVTKLAARACTTKPPKDHCVPGEITPAEDPCALDKMLVGKQKVGEPCAPSGTDCLPELRCAALRGNDGACTERAKVGEPCSRDGECGKRLVCDARTGRCVAGGDVGAACSFTDPDRPTWELTADRCRTGLQCDTVSRKCGAETCVGGSYCSSETQCPVGLVCAGNRCGVLVKDGEACNNDTDCGNGRCRYDALHGRYSCASPAPDGAVCQGGNDKDCVSHYCDYDSAASQYVCKPSLPTGATCPQGDRQCVSGRCRLNGSTSIMECAAPVPVGQTCATDPDCSPVASLFCVNTKCAAPPFDIGAVCTQPEQCKSKLCSKGKCAAFAQVGAACGTAETPPCDKGLYCSGPLNGPNTCAAKKPFGALCKESQECFGGCSPAFGAMRCRGADEGQAYCSGQ